MPNIKRRICQVHGIIEKTPCELCKSENAKVYNKTARNQESAAIYKSRRWRKVREHILKRDFGVCQRCGHSYKSMIVDHKKELKDYPELAFSYENLETLCRPCHNSKTAQERVNR